MSTRCNIEFYDEPGIPGGELGEPAARIYQHSDGYPEGVLKQLKKLERRLKGKDPELHKLPHFYDKKLTAADSAKVYGQRLDDPEWAAAEYITMFRFPMAGNIYVSQHNHGDIAFLYRVVCTPHCLQVHVFTPEEVNGVTTYVKKVQEKLL